MFKSIVSTCCLGLLVLSCKGNDEPSASPTKAAEPTKAAAPSVAKAALKVADKSEAASIHSLTMKRLDGTEVSLSEWKGKTVLVVNTASKCGHTPQYEGLQALHAKYKDQGFAVLGFPSNDFGGQEPGTSKEIAEFCTSMYSVNFPMFEKVATKGVEQAPLYALLSKAHGEPKWNFHKYLINKDGMPVQAWASAVKPRSAEVIEAIEKQLTGDEAAVAK